MTSLILAPSVGALPLSSAGIFPIPIVIGFDALGLTGATRAVAIDLFERVGEEKGLQWRHRFVPDRGKWDVHPVTAFEAERRMGFGRDAASPELNALHRVVTDAFFPGVNFFGKEGRLEPVEIRLRDNNPFPDGDTASITAFKRRGQWVDAPLDALIDGAAWVSYKASVRMDGVDSLESYRGSDKYARNVIGIANYLQMKYAIPEGDRAALIALVGARIAYLGGLAGVVTNAFGKHFKDEGIRMGPAYTMTSSNSELYDTLDLWDKYGRLIGRILAGGENADRDLIAGFMQYALPQAMTDAGASYHAAYMEEAGRMSTTLESWKKNKKLFPLYGILGPHTAPVPAEIFSSSKSARLALTWSRFVAHHPEATNDLQTASAFMGISPPYPKYAGHMTELDLMAEQVAFGAVPGEPSSGLVDDPIFQLSRPAASRGDPRRSEAYSDPAIGQYMSGVENLGRLDPLGLQLKVAEMDRGDIL